MTASFHYYQIMIRRRYAIVAIKTGTENKALVWKYSLTGLLYLFCNTTDRRWRGFSFGCERVARLRHEVEAS